MSDTDNKIHALIKRLDDGETCLDAIDEAIHELRRLDEAETIVSRLLNYRHFNTANFQLEKLDDYLNQLRQLMAL